MSLYRYFFVFILSVLGANFIKCSEFVPVYIWGSSKISEHVPALHKISEDSFKDTLLEYLKKKPYIIAFVEPALSSEDFSRRNQGETAYPNLESLIKSSSAIYRPNVKNPVSAIKQLGLGVTEISIKSLIDNPNVPEDNILIVDLNDAKDDEHRFQMLKRHDSDIFTIYNDLAEQHKDVLAIYTAYHNSWVEPEEVAHKRTARDLLQAQAEDDSKVYNTSDALLYLGGRVEIWDGENVKLNDTVFNADSLKTGDDITVTLTHKSGTKIDIVMQLISDMYWKIANITSDGTNYEFEETYLPLAPTTFSYHCQNLKIRSGTKRLVLPGLQIQPTSNATSFGDAYDCVGFTSIAIWSGLFVTAILLLILTFGLTMIMDIKTMDRFDDSKGKTITINAAE